MAIRVKPTISPKLIPLPSVTCSAGDSFSVLVFSFSSLVQVYRLYAVFMFVQTNAYHREPNSLMVLETPLLRVSRPVAACSRCRAAKVKCDGKLPACTACEKSNRASECSSTNDQFARGKERSYVATLEARVERLEKKIAESRNRRKSSTILMLDTSEAPTPRRTSVDTLKAPKPISKRAARRKEASQIDELVSDFGLL
jgi:hypothetical protein